MTHMAATPETRIALSAPSGHVGSGAWLGDWPRTGKVIARFSCGAASAVATKLALEKYGDAVEIYNTDPGSEHEDNPRFLADCERWYGRKIHVLHSERYRDVDDVIDRRNFLVGPKFAVCTEELKKLPGMAVTQIGDVEIYGYTVEERERVERWRTNNPERIIECPLIDRELTKEDCFGVLDRVGIELPAMYRLGFDNNNCIGCVKARDHLNYWKRVRKHFPEVFARRAAQERKLGVAINRVTRDGVRRPIFLDEIPPGDPTGPDSVKISCGLFCMAEADGFSPNTLLDGCADDKKTQ